MALCMEYQFDVVGASVCVVCVCILYVLGRFRCRCYCDGSCALFGAICFKGEDVRSCVTLPSYRRRIFRVKNDKRKAEQRDGNEFVVCSQKLILNQFPIAHGTRAKSYSIFIFMFIVGICLRFEFVCLFRNEKWLCWIFLIHFVCDYRHSRASCIRVAL